MREFVGVILTQRDGSVLAQHRDNNPNISGPGMWAVLGGAKEFWDIFLRRTGGRELWEETGYRINIFDLHFLTRDIYQSERGRLIRRTIYVAEYDGRQKIECHEGQEIRFISPEELTSLEELGKIYTGHGNFLRRASEWGRGKL